MLPHGTRLSHFEIVKHIGSGGMGEVYEATDLNLDRRVALKVLPLEATRDESRIARFMREAKAASALNHPHIITVYEIGREGEQHFIAMELVEGETLRDLLLRTKNPRELLPLFGQIADGLAKAHAAGIVHRDLKPENVMVTHDGYAKILDFGLAKLVQADVSGEEKTATRNLTEQGTVMGTLGYMSPEQLRGVHVDHRTDIFACGCILYESFAGEQPFRGASRVDTTHNILHETPAPLPVADVQRVAAKALAKNPEERHQSAREFASDVRALSTAAPAPPRRKSRWIAAAAAVTAIVALAVVWLAKRREQTPLATQSSGSFQSMSIVPLPGTSDADDVAISKDGNYVAYTRESPDGFALIVRQVRSGSEATLVPAHGTDVTGPRFTPDSQTIYYRDGDKLFAVPLFGGSPTKVRDGVSTPVSFSADGSEIAYANRGSLYVAPVAGGAARRIAGATSKETFSNPEWSPDGTTIAAVRRSLQGALRSNIQLIRAGGDDPVAAAAAWANDLPGTWPGVAKLSWLPDGKGVIVSTMFAMSGPRQILEVPVDKDGATRRITNDLYSYDALSIDAKATIAAAVQSDRRWSIVEVPLRSNAPERQIAEGTGLIAHVSTAPDGDVVYAAPSGEGLDLWIRSGNATRQLTTGENEASVPQVSPDGRTIAYAGEADGRVNVWRIDRDGANRKQLTAGGFVRNPRWSPDGKAIYFTTRDRGRAELMRLPADGGPPELISTPYSVRPAPSPDGKMLAAVSEYKWRLGFIDAATGETIRETSLSDIDGQLRWSRDGTKLAFLRKEKGITNVHLYDWKTDKTEQLTHFVSGWMSSFDWGAGEQSLICGRSKEVRRIVLIRKFR